MSGSSSTSRWMYTSSVNDALWCPSHAWTCFAFNPRETSSVAHVWRSVWRPTHGTPFACPPLELRGTHSTQRGGPPCSPRKHEGDVVRTRSLAPPTSDSPSPHRVERPDARDATSVARTHLGRTAAAQPLAVDRGPRPVQRSATASEIRSPVCARHSTTNRHSGATFARSARSSWVRLSAPYPSRSKSRSRSSRSSSSRTSRSSRISYSLAPVVMTTIAARTSGPWPRRRSSRAWRSFPSSEKGQRLR
jgi:hypothetical protein